MKITVKNTTARDVAVAKDRVLAELSHTAAAPRKLKPVATEPDRKKYPSRFFFTISNSEHEEIERRKKKFKPRAVVHDDSHITGRLKTYKHQLPERMKTLEDRFREFWLNEIAPRTLAAETATNQAKEIVQRSAGVANVDVPAAMVASLMGRALELRMARFIKDYMRLNAAEHAALVQPKPVAPAPAPAPQINVPQAKPPTINIPAPKVVVMSQGQSRGRRFSGA